MIQLKKDTDNIVTLIFDMKEREHNVINHELCDAFVPVFEHLKKEKARGVLKGVILTSAKSSFLSGGDLGYLYNDHDPQHLFEAAEKMSAFFRDLEQPGVPVVAAMAGTALGTGFELALACHHRILLDDPKVRVGMPEVNLGLMPSGGSLTRVMWLLGIEKAFKVLTSGRHYLPQEALKVGIIDDLANSKKELIEKAKDWLLTNRDLHRPWDLKDKKIPGGTAHNPKLAERIRIIAARLAAETYNNSLAKRAILNILVEGSKVDFQTARRIENRRYVRLVCSKMAKNMISTFWFDYHAIKKGLNRPKGYGKFRVRKVGIIGAGQMGSSIGFSCILNGISVVLKDASKAIAKRGKDYVEQRIDESINKGTFHSSARSDILAKITTTADAADFRDCDMIIEAVFENLPLKQKVTHEAEEHIDEYSIIGTNTVSIPISTLAENCQRPENYLGIHFFHPPEAVPLVEIVRGEQTSDETIARAFDFVNSIQKIPIIVKDNWGFYAGRVRNTYILEGISLLLEGYSPALIENLGRQSGMPSGPLELADELGLELILEYENQAAKHYGKLYVQHPAVSVLHKMIKNLNRKGKSKGNGFYEYSEIGRQLWTELAKNWPISITDYDRQVLTERLLFAQIIEALWCIQEKVILSPASANLGSVFGWGFPKEKGGVIRYIYDYEPDKFIIQGKRYHKLFGQRFRVPKVLKRILDTPRMTEEKAAVG